MALRKSAVPELDGNFVVMGPTTISALPPSGHPNVTDRLIVALSAASSVRRSARAYWLYSRSSRNSASTRLGTRKRGGVNDIAAPPLAWPSIP